MITTLHLLDIDYRFELPVRYDAQGIVGIGSSSVLCEANDRAAEGSRSVIKKVVVNPQNCKQTLRELKMLYLLRHENLLSLRDVFGSLRPPCTDVYFVTDRFDTDLAAVLSSSMTLTTPHIQLLLFQILRGLQYLHGRRIVHRCYS